VLVEESEIMIKIAMSTNLSVMVTLLFLALRPATVVADPPAIPANTTVALEMVSIPPAAGAGQACSFKIYLTPNINDVNSFQFRVYYDNAKLGSMAFTDNSGQGDLPGRWDGVFPPGGADNVTPNATLGGEVLDATYSSYGCNAYNSLIVDTLADYITPTNIALITFTTKAGFTLPASACKLVLANVNQGLYGGITLQNGLPVPHVFASHDTNGFYTHPALLAPVSVSLFTAD